eukprot:UC1_evm1s216
MVLLAASICTKSGKAVVSRQFMEVSRSRVEGLLAAFPKLKAADEQHTFIETENVRYVYRPMESLFFVLITTKNSNILEDLETLRLFTRVVPEYCKVMTEYEVSRNAFELIFAFDEIVSLGYRESVDLRQIRTITEMDSHDENIARMLKKSKERDAKEEAKRRAKQLSRERRERERGFGGGGSGGGGMGGRGMGGGMGGGGGVGGGISMGAPAYTAPPPARAPAKKKSGMKLGSKGGKNKDFVSALRAEGQEVSAVEDMALGSSASKSMSASAGTSIPSSATSAVGVASSGPTEALHVTVEERLTLAKERDGGVESFECKGTMTVLAREAASARVAVAVDRSQAPSGVSFNTHPNVDKKAWKQGVIRLKNTDKPFPLNTAVGVLKWRLASTEEGDVPLMIACWPNDNGDGSCNVSLEYELQVDHLELRDVTITVPLPSGAHPVVEDAGDGSYAHDKRRGVLDWVIPLVDSDNADGSLEFRVDTSDTNDFFPVLASWSAPMTMCRVE